MQAEDAATDMGGQSNAAVAAAAAVLQEASTAVAKQLQRAIPEAQNMFSEEHAGAAAAVPHAGLSQEDASASEGSGSEVHTKSYMCFVQLVVRSYSLLQAYHAGRQWKCNVLRSCPVGHVFDFITSLPLHSSYQI